MLKSRKIRLAVRKTNKYVITQFVQLSTKGDETIATANSKELKKFGFEGKCNTPSAYLTGLLCAKRAKEKGVDEFILDIGMHSATKGSLVFAVLKGALDAGLKTNFSGGVLPDEDRISAKHLSESVQKQFEEAKKKLLV